MKKRLLLISALLLLMLLMLTHTELVMNGARAGLELWYSSVLPILLPFMIVTSLLRQYIHSEKICYLGLLCGLPVGASLVDRQYASGGMSAAKANSLLCICNLASPMFLCGYIWNRTLHKEVSLLYLLLLLYLPILLYSMISNLISGRLADRSVLHTSHDKKTPETVETVLTHCIRIILLTGVYIMLFRIMIELLSSVNCLNTPCLQTAVTFLSSTLEITSGIQVLSALPLSLQQKTALIAGLTSFGGICSIFQTKSAISQPGLSLTHYICIKLLFGVCSILLGMSLPPF